MLLVGSNLGVEQHFIRGIELGPGESDTLVIAGVSRLLRSRRSTLSQHVGEQIDDACNAKADKLSLTRRQSGELVMATRTKVRHIAHENADTSALVAMVNEVTSSDAELDDFIRSHAAAATEPRDQALLVLESLKAICAEPRPIYL